MFECLSDSRGNINCDQDKFKGLMIEWREGGEVSV